MHLDLNLIYILIQVIFLEGILSIDNAAVLGAMVSVLPRQEMVPWPGPLKSLGPPVHRLLGGQRSAALKVGLFRRLCWTWPHACSGQFCHPQSLS